MFNIEKTLWPIGHPFFGLFRWDVDFWSRINLLQWLCTALSRQKLLQNANKISVVKHIDIDYF